MAVYLRYFIYGIFAIVLGCGSRKVQTSISNTEQKDITKETSKGQVTKDSENSSNSGNSVQNNITNEKQEQRITELYNDNGSLKSRISELLNSKSTDNTISTYYINTRSYIHSDSVFNNTHYIDRTITIKTKEKATTRKNDGVYYLVAFAVLIAGLLAWLKWVRK